MCGYQVMLVMSGALLFSWLFSRKMFSAHISETQFLNSVIPFFPFCLVTLYLLNGLAPAQANDCVRMTVLFPSQCFRH